MTVFLINSFSGGGAERLVVDEINECIRRGIAVRCITLRPEKDFGSFLPECRIRASDRRTIVFRGLFDACSWCALIRTLRRWQPRVLITHLWFANTVGRIAGALCRVPVIVSFEHNVYDLMKSRVQFFVDRMLQRFSHRIVAVSGAVASSLVRHGILRDKIVVILNGIDLTRFSAPHKVLPRAALGIPDGEFLYLFIGRLTRQKGVDILIEAFRSISRGFLCIVGDGEERGTLEALVGKYALQARVRFLGPRKDIPELLSLADCAVFPSRWEGFGIAAVEAMAVGVPVIASDVDGFQEIIASGTDSVLVPAGDVHALKKAMEQMMNDADFRGMISRNAARRAKDFGIARHVDELTLLIAPS